VEDVTLQGADSFTCWRTAAKSVAISNAVVVRSLGVVCSVVRRTAYACREARLDPSGDEA